MRDDDVLDTSPGLGRRESFVLAVELDALPGDDALVARVVQGPAEFFGRQWPRWSLGGRSLGEPADIQFGR